MKTRDRGTIIRQSTVEIITVVGVTQGIRIVFINRRLFWIFTTELQLYIELWNPCDLKAFDLTLCGFSGFLL